MVKNVIDTKRFGYRCYRRAWVCLALAVIVSIYFMLVGQYINAIVGSSSDEKGGGGGIGAFLEEFSQGSTSSSLSGISSSSGRSSSSGYEGLAWRKSQNANKGDMSQEIARKWKLTSPRAAALLERQFEREAEYDPSMDFVYFHHIQKAGGTSISDLLNQSLGSSRILPGSQRSGRFKVFEFYEALGADRKHGMIRTGTGPDRKLLPMLPPDAGPSLARASFGETALRPVHGPRQSSLGSFFRAYLPILHNQQGAGQTQRLRPQQLNRRSAVRLRLLAMLRDPTDLRASRQAMTMCAINGKVDEYNSRRRQQGLERVCSPQDGLNISHLVDHSLAKLLDKCRRHDAAKHNLSQKEQLICDLEAKGVDSHRHCRSPSHLLSSERYNQTMRNLLKPLMGRYHNSQDMEDFTYFNITAMQHNNNQLTSQLIEEYTLIDLGGLDRNIKHSSYNNTTDPTRDPTDPNRDDPQYYEPTEPDFLWFGITERMHESTCLLYRTLHLKPLPKLPTKRVMKCPPSSWWTQDDRNQVQKLEMEDYAVWRAANAILDIRVLQMKEEIDQKMQNIEKLSLQQKEEVLALVHAGCLDAGNKE